MGKLVSVVSGEIFDVAVDVRPCSATYGKWHGEILDGKYKTNFWIPDGFLHGFYVGFSSLFCRFHRSAIFSFNCLDFAADAFWFLLSLVFFWNSTLIFYGVVLKHCWGILFSEIEDSLRIVTWKAARTCCIHHPYCALLRSFSRNSRGLRKSQNRRGDGGRAPCLTTFLGKQFCVF